MACGLVLLLQGVFAFHLFPGSRPSSSTFNIDQRRTSSRIEASSCISTSALLASKGGGGSDQGRGGGGKGKSQKPATTTRKSSATTTTKKPAGGGSKKSLSLGDELAWSLSKKENLPDFTDLQPALSDSQVRIKRLEDDCQ